MSMTLEEAIEHAERVAAEQSAKAKTIESNPWGEKSKVRSKIQDCLNCAEEHRQLAAWLRELAERRKEPKIITCGECDYREIRGVDGFCDHITGEPIMVKKTDHCSWAERKVDG